MKGKKPYRKYTVLAVVLILIIGIFAARARQSGSKQPDVQTDVVKRGIVLSSVSGNGVLEPLTTVEVKSNVGGQVVKLAVDEGDMVKAGQLIAKIDPSDSISTLEQAQADYSSTKSKVNQARQALSMQRLQTSANIISAEQALESSRQKLSQAEQQAEVQPKLTTQAIAQAQSSLDSAQASLNQTKSALNPQKLASAKASLDQAQASYKQSEKNLSRQRALLGKGFVAQSQVDSAEEAFSTAKAQLESAQKKHDTVEEECNEDLKNAKSKVAQAKAALETAQSNRMQDDLKRKDLAASRASVKQAMAALASTRAAAYQDQMKSEDILQSQAQLEKSNAALENAQTQVGYTTIVAPRSGVVVKKYVEEGSIVTAGRQAMAGSGSGVTIVEIADVSKMQVVADVDETDVSKITLGQQVDVSIDAFPGELFPAKVIKIAPEAEVNQNVTTVPVTVELEQTDSRLKPQMNATCDFVISRKENVIYVPVEAITETDSGTEVTLVDHEKQVVHKVEVGLTGDDYCEIVSGLNVGETVVIPDEETTTSTSKGGPGGGPGGPPPM
ncbi:MAG: efflux RND transporter periplasmic adaptor subunit [Armatimonadota bacterium]|nr:efflux RND transporter periplasmic adaptor subunit [bacterium]